MIFYGWFIVAAGFLILLVSWGSIFSFGVFLIPLTEEFGWNRASTAGISSLTILLFGLGSIVSGRLTERLTPRRIAITGGLLVGGGLALSAAIQNLWHLYVFFGLIIGLGVSAGYVPLVATLARWFIAQRGVAMGIMSMGISFGIILLPPLSRELITIFGWRLSFLILGLLSGLVIIGSAFILCRDPRDKGLSPHVGQPSKTVGQTDASPPAVERMSRDFRFSEAVATSAFWKIFSSYLLWCVGFYMVSIHIAAYGTERGLSPMASAFAVSLIGFGSIFGKIFMGLLSDRIGPKRVLVINLLMQGISIFGLIASKSAVPIYLFAGIFGFGYGGTGPQIPVLAAQLFGLSALGAIFGALLFSGQLGGAIGPLLGGRMFDLTQSYHSAFSLGGLAVMISVLLLYFVKPPKAKNSVGVSEEKIRVKISKV
ncbi:MAG: MFS transporter [Deltaproteobacteria bacterium]|nr:MFS transporter [Deltaproteobacteria bacterium]